LRTHIKGLIHQSKHRWHNFDTKGQFTNLADVISTQRKLINEIEVCLKGLQELGTGDS
jgi:hypothetical protein